MYSAIMDDAPSPAAALRIGELSRRLGVSDHVLRAWERRYGLLQPVRTAGGFRLYSEADLDRVRRMQAHLANGLSAAQAARAAIDEEPTGERRASPDGPLIGLDEERAALRRTLDAFDEPAAHAVLDRLLGALTIETILRDVILPYLRDLGERWQSGTATVTQEHFASNLLRGRLAGLARGWGHGRGPRAVLACAPGELHDIALLAFGLILHRNGWRVDFLGADTPLAALQGLAEELRPDLVVLAATTPDRFESHANGLRQLAQVCPLALAGAGATPAAAAIVGARSVAGDPVTAAERLASGNWN